MAEEKTFSDLKTFVERDGNWQLKYDNGVLTPYIRKNPLDSHSVSLPAVSADVPFNEMVSNFVDMLDAYNGDIYVQDELDKMEFPTLKEVRWACDTADRVQYNCKVMAKKVDEEFLPPSALDKLNDLQNVKTSTVILIEPGRFPVEKEIPRTETAVNNLLQSKRGYCPERIESGIFPDFVDDQVSVLVDSMAFPDRPVNRTLRYTEDGNPVHALYGPIVIVGYENKELGEPFGDMSEESKEFLKDYFQKPERISTYEQDNRLEILSRKVDEEFSVVDPVKDTYRKQNEPELS